MDIDVLVTFLAGFFFGGLVGISFMLIVAIALTHEKPRKEHEHDKN